MKTITEMQTIIKDLNGRPILNGEFDEQGILIPNTLKPISIAKMIASLLARGSSQDSVRMIDLALKLYSTEEDEFEFEDSDLTQIIQIVQQDKRSTNIIKATILKVLI